MIQEMAERNMQQMTNDFLKFCNIEIKKQIQILTQMQVFDINIEQIIVFDAKKETDAKYFIGYDYNKKLDYYWLKFCR